MARFINGQVLTALAAGMVGGLLAPLVWPAASRVARPAAKSALKAGFAAFERGREIAAEWAETTSDLIAEVEAERDEERRAASVAAHGGGQQQRQQPHGDAVVPMNGSFRSGGGERKLDA